MAVKLKNLTVLVAFSFLLLMSLGYSWEAGYNNRVQLNVSTTTLNYTGVAVPIVLNASVLGSNACVDSYACNDSLVTDLSDTPLFFYNEYYNASANWLLYVNITYLNTTATPVYFYYNSSNLTRSSYYNGNKVFLRFNDFENYTNYTRVSADFGASDTFYGEGIEPYSLDSINCAFKDNCLLFQNTVTNGLLYGFMTLSYDKGILEWYYRIQANPPSDATFYVMTNGFINGSNDGSFSSYSSVASLTLNNTWTKVKYIWNGAVSNVSFDGGTPKILSALASNASQIAFPRYTTSPMPFYSDNYFLRQLIEEPITLTIGNIENAPTLPDYLNLTYLSPDILNETANHSITFAIIPTASSDYINCSLRINSTLYANESAVINNSAVSWTIILANGTYDFNMSCYTTTLYNSTENYNINVLVPVITTPIGECKLSTLQNSYNRGEDIVLVLNGSSIYTLFDSNGLSDWRYILNSTVITYSAETNGMYWAYVNCSAGISAVSFRIVDPSLNWTAIFIMILGALFFLFLVWYGR